MTPTMPTPGPAGIDPRGPRFAAGVTAVLLAVVVLLGASTPALVLLAVVAASFLVGAVGGAHRTWQGWIFRTLVRPRVGPPRDLEDPRPPRFAQGVGLVVTGVGVVLGLAGVLAAVPWAAAIAFVAAALNATLGLCLGCEMYLLLRRARSA
ncbi:DUF4395 domain-containing protein [Isoptericola variabilis]|uniref:DUF4395 domain-containing protein n=1 Tax=Isoptericola variabilis (strain 225) TaxID=743718 RepID=F6FUG5_ISOV2|nr:DUF4395 domain-containing protein [Isoptericola variabilis]AEG45392.1 hypothetical protein Isova_2690 [Isoptericola variabilis 225]TWH30264.1 uncharacterized protein DUF4395 [Isoptericola variabilis J7]